MVFQRSLSALSPVHRVGDQLRDVLSIHEPRLSEASRNERVTAVLDAVHLPARVVRAYPFELSGGMMQRTMIALGLLCNPPFMIFDEATTALDVITQSQILSEVQRLKTRVQPDHDCDFPRCRGDQRDSRYRGSTLRRSIDGSSAAYHILPETSTPILPGADWLRASPQRPQGADIGDSGIAARPHQSAKGVPIRTSLPPCDRGMYGDNATAGGGWAGSPRSMHRVRDDGRRRCVSESALIELDHLQCLFPVRKGFGDVITRTSHHVHAVDSVSASIARGEILALVGESGCGKSTLGRMLVRLESPTGGGIRFDGTEVQGLSGRALKEFRRRAQIIFQNPFEAFDPRLTVGESLHQALRIHNIGERAAREQRIVAMMERSGLRPAQRLSRALPARALRRAIAADGDRAGDVAGTGIPGCR